MNQPNFKDYETLQEYARAVKAYTKYQAEEAKRKAEERERSNEKSAKRDFEAQFPSVLPFMAASGIHYEFYNISNGDVHLYLYPPEEDISLTHFEMRYYVDVFEDGEHKTKNMWMVARYTTEEEIINKILEKSGLIKSDLPF